VSCRLQSQLAGWLGDREWLGQGKGKVLESEVTVAQVAAENASLIHNSLCLTQTIPKTKTQDMFLFLYWTTVPKRTTTFIPAVLALQL